MQKVNVESKDEEKTEEGKKAVSAGGYVPLAK